MNTDVKNNKLKGIEGRGHRGTENQDVVKKGEGYCQGVKCGSSRQRTAGTSVIKREKKKERERRTKQQREKCRTEGWKSWVGKGRG